MTDILDTGIKAVSAALVVAGVVMIWSAQAQRAAEGRKYKQLVCTTDGKVTFRSDPTEGFIQTMYKVPGWDVGQGVYYPRGGEICKVYYVK